MNIPGRLNFNTNGDTTIVATEKEFVQIMKISGRLKSFSASRWDPCSFNEVTSVSTEKFEDVSKFIEELEK
jgi:hypothetical protein